MKTAEADIIEWKEKFSKSESQINRLKGQLEKVKESNDAAEKENQGLVDARAISLRTIQELKNENQVMSAKLGESEE